MRVFVIGGTRFIGPPVVRQLIQTLKRIDDKRPCILFEEKHAQWQFCRGYVENVAAAIVLAITNDTAAEKIYNVSEQQTYTEAGWAQKIASATKWKGEITILPKDQMPEHLTDEANWEQNLQTDSTRIREDLGYSEIISPDEGLAKTIAWERENPPPKIDESHFNYEAEDRAFENHKR